MPRIKSRIPDATLTVVGRNPYPSLLELAKSDKSIIVTGRVADVRPYMERADAYVVPLRVGGGTRLKIFEAMAMEKADCLDHNRRGRVAGYRWIRVVAGRYA